MRGLLAALAAAAVLAAGGTVEQLAPELEGITVALPDGSRAALVGDRDALLTVEELATCLATVDEAGAWPALWLVVQREDEPFDLVVRLERDETGRVRAELPFTTARREWEPGDVKVLARERLGRKPPRPGLANVVVQGFSKKTVTTFRYRVRPSDEGLAALLAPGALIRDAKSIALPGAPHHTLALVIEDATFRPADCSRCGAGVFGHADSGRVSLVLTDGASVLDTLDLTPQLGGFDGSPLVPRFACESGDRADAGWSELSSRPPVPLLRPEDRDGDGLALEIGLPAGVDGCETWTEVVIAVDPRTRKLRILERISRPL